MRAEFVSIRGGTAEILRETASRAARPGDRLGEGETIRTGAGATAVLRIMPGSSRVVVGPASELTFARLRARAVEMNVPRGAVWTRALLPRDGTMRMSGPNASAGVRGTRFSVLASDTFTHVCDCEGEVEVVSPRGRAVLTRGEFAEVRADGPPPSPQDERRILRRPPADGSFDFCFTCHVRGGGGELERNSYFDL